MARSYPLHEVVLFWMMRSMFFWAIVTTLCWFGGNVLIVTGTEPSDAALVFVTLAAMGAVTFVAAVVLYQSLDQGDMPVMQLYRRAAVAFYAPMLCCMVLTQLGVLDITLFGSVEGYLTTTRKLAFLSMTYFAVLVAASTVYLIAVPAARETHR